VTHSLVLLGSWAAEHGVIIDDLLELARENLLPAAEVWGRLYVEPAVAEVVWAEHGKRIVAGRLPTPPESIEIHEGSEENSWDQNRVRIVAETLRFVAAQMHSTGEDDEAERVDADRWLEAAAGAEEMDPSWWLSWSICPLCRRLTCRNRCPLAPLREGLEVADDDSP
jgi:hypothetical protein